MEHGDWVGFLVPILSDYSSKYSILSFDMNFIIGVNILVRVVMNGIHDSSRSYIIVSRVGLTEESLEVSVLHEMLHSGDLIIVTNEVALVHFVAISGARQFGVFIVA